MRGATECAKRLKGLFSSLRSKLGKVGPPPITDPITQLVLGILTRDTPEAKALEGLERLRSMVVDYNELRVIPPIELASTLGDFPDARLKCEDVSRALNAIFAHEHGTTLERLAELPRKEACDFLARVDGLEPYTRARVRLLGLRQHAVPLDEAMWALARREQVVDARCGLEEAQHFLERNVAEEDALEFYALLKKHAWSEMSVAVKKREVERILSVPPDRTSRNMLQTVTASLAALETEDFAGDSDLAWEGAAPAESAPPTAGKRASAATGTTTKARGNRATRAKTKPAKRAKTTKAPRSKRSASGSRSSAAEGRTKRAATRDAARQREKPAGNERKSKSGRKRLSRATG